MKKNFIAAAICGLGLLASGAASAVIVGGVDFGSLGAASHLETSTIAETLVLANGDKLSGYGQIDTVNGESAYAGTTQKLYFVFKDYLAKDFNAGAPGLPGSVGFTGGVVDVYLGNKINLLNNSSPTNLSTILGYTKFVEFTGHNDQHGYSIFAIGTLTGSKINFDGNGLLDVVLGTGLADVAAYLNANAEPDARGNFADVAFGSNGKTGRNTSDVCNNVAGDYCIQGSANFSGSTVPEPSVLALLGLGMLGIGASLRKRKSA